MSIGKQGEQQALRTEKKHFTLAPAARAVALALAAGGVTSIAHAGSQAFSGAWFAAKGAAKNTAMQTGAAPGGVSLLSPTQQSAAARQQLQTSISNLNRTAAAIAAQQAAQAAARQAALNAPAGVPDGLAEGGLQVDDNPMTQGWLNAQAPVQAQAANGRTTVVIHQTGDKAILNWKTFNIGRNTTVDFVQQPDWVVMNRVNDPNQRPSQILGQIQADGTVLVVNRNGIIFTGTSQVNARNLVAAAANISDSQFQSAGIYGATSSNSTLPSFTDAAGSIVVQAGAQLNTAAPSSVTQGGGYVLLMGQEVDNAGAIVTPGGQAELAAGDSFIIRKGYGTDANTASTTRGNEISPQLKTNSTAGTVSNTGLLTASEGDITLAGHNVLQNGVAVSTTTVNQRGTIHLLNSISDATGSVTLGSSATTAVVLEDNGATALDSQRSALIADSVTQNTGRSQSARGVFDNLSLLADREDLSRIEIVSGNTVDFGSGSMTLATGGQIAVTAKGRTQLEDAAVLDVSGAVGVTLAMSSNNVQVNVQGNEQRDAPANRDSGALNNSNVWIDTRRLLHVAAGTGGYAGDRYYTAGGLLEVSGYLGTQGHTIGEWAATGGTVTLAGNEVVTRPGSLVNIAGGSYDVQGGTMNVSWLLGSDGHLYTVDNAPANITYTGGVYQGYADVHPRWGQTFYYRSPLIGPRTIEQSGYTVGRDAGQLIVSAPTAVLDGSLDANVYHGPSQTKAPDASVTDSYLQSQLAVARPGGLALAQYAATGLFGVYATDVKIGDVAPLQGELGVNDALPEDRIGTAWLDAAALNAAGLGSLSLSTKDAISIDAPLQLAPGGQLTLTAPDIDIAANITAPSGSINATNMFNGPNPLLDPQGQARIVVEKDVTINLRGLWTNALLDPVGASGLAYVNGGSATFDTSGDVTFASGSVLDVSSGAAVLAKGKTVGGKGGDVTLIAGDTAGDSTSTGGSLALDGNLRAMGVTGGGSLVMSSSDTVVLGHEASIDNGTLAAGTAAPVDLALGQPLVIPAGQPLPMSATLGYTTITPGVPVPTDVPLGTPPTTPTGADWIVPTGLFVWIGNTLKQSGDRVPMGSVITSFAGTRTLAAGTVIPVGVFPDGLPVLPYSVVYTKGQVLSSPLTYFTGTRVPVGTVLSENVAIQAPREIDPALFQTGFASYDINSGNGVLVTTGANIAPAMPVYRFTSASVSTPTGADPTAALSAWLPPLYAEDATSTTLTQRGGASLTLSSLINDSTGVIADGGSIVVEKNASVTVDPGQAIELDAFRQITIDGSLTAHGGSISVANKTDGLTDAARNFNAAGDNRGMSLWIGDDAKLDVSGQAYRATDLLGRAYGIAADGGSIALDGSTAFVVVRPGAELNADGTAVAVDMSAGHPTASSGDTVTLAGNGGSIEFSSGSGMYLDGDYHARGDGPGAAAGSLSVSLNTLNYYFGPNKVGPPNRIVPSVMTVQQSQPALLPADIAPGTDIDALNFGQATVSADKVQAGGFGSLSLHSGDYMMFSGDVRLALGQSLTLSASAFTSGPSLPNATAANAVPTSNSVVVSAPYILLQSNPIVIPDNDQSGSIRNPSVSLAKTTATFEADADQLDIQGLVVFSANATQYDATAHANVGTQTPGFLTTRLVSQGDIRFLPTSVTQNTLYSPWDITLDAAQIYPATGVQAWIMAGINNPDYKATLTLGRTTDSIPDTPQSVFGKLLFSAPIVEQGAVVRAPFGQLTFGSDSVFTNPIKTERLDLLPGSLASVSMAGITVPYGGTVDGVTYTYNGKSVGTPSLTNIANSVPAYGIDLDAGSINVQAGATLDLSGGGTLAGAGFISGRGGSVNVLNTPLVNANPTIPVSKAGDKVYAILPGYASGYAPVSPEHGAGDPAIGQTITIGAGVPGLPAGTYTLLPSNYALLPGAYRVEVGKNLLPGALGTAPLGDGTWSTTGYLGVSNTGIRKSAPSQLLVTPGDAVRKYSQYDEEGYSDFQLNQAARFGTLRPLLPQDGKTLQLAFEMPSTTSPTSTPTSDPALTFDGTALLQGAQGGFGGQVLTRGIGEIYADAPTTGFNGVSVSAAALNAIDAPRLSINGFLNYVNGLLQAVSAGGSDLFIRDGVTLHASEIFLFGGDIDIGKNVTLSTIGQGPVPYDSVSTGMPYSVNGATVLALSNGELDFQGSNTAGRGAINVGEGSSLYSAGTLAFATNGSVSLDSGAHFGSRDISLSVGNLNIGSDADIAAGGAPDGVSFNQALFDMLVHGNVQAGVPALQTLTLSAGDSINLFGTTGLDARGSGVDLVMNTPAIYGYGTADDVATIAADKIEWNGISGSSAPALVTGGPGSGSGTLVLDADEIDLGQFVHLDATNTIRTTYGFANVELDAASRIVAAGNTALYVYQSPDSTAGAVFGESGIGGNLTLRTPLLTGAQMSIVSYTAGGALSVVAPDGVAPSTATSTVAGAEIDLSGDNVAIGSTVLLPSGKLVVKAEHDITLRDGSRLDLSGQPSTIQRATVYGFGGIVTLDSAQGNVTQAAGGVVNVSATHADAGSISATASDGVVALAGALQGSSDDSHTSGDFSASANTIADFDGLNARLTQGGVFDARSFDQRTGDLTIGDGVKAHTVTVSVDDGSLTVTGKIDASGAAPGSIRLAAINGLTLGPNAVLDAHGTVLQTDSYGQPIAAKNRGHIELTVATGALTLSPGATMDLSTPDGVAYGDILLNVPRTSETSGDIAIDTPGPLNIRGAYSVALNAMWTYDLPGGSVISQSTLDGYDTQSQAFISAAYGGNPAAGVLTAGLQNKLGGLTTLGTAFHLRPGVEITSSGDLSTSGDINLAGYRYGPGADRDLNSATYGAGEPMDLVVRAGGNLNIAGSVSDGFGPVPGSPAVPPVYTGVVAPHTTLATTWVFDTTIYLTTDWVVPDDDYYRNVVGYLMDYSTGAQYNPGDPVPKDAQFKPDDYNSFEAGVDLPGYATGIAVPGRPATSGLPPTSPLAYLLAGAQSASVRLVAGADLGAADMRALQAPQSLQGRGNLNLSDPNYNSTLSGTYISVLRTGTGDLDLLAGGNFSEATPYGVYTAGTQSAPILAANGSNPYDLNYQANFVHNWYPEQGGDVLISAQGDVSGNIQMSDNTFRYVDSSLITNWLWLQGGAGLTADPGAWSINFGSFGQTSTFTNDSSFMGFQGIGTLGGGNLTVIAGRNAGTLTNGNVSTGLNLAVASTGRVLADGTLVQTGGGDLVLKVGGTVNPVNPNSVSNQVPDYFGTVTNLRGNIDITADAVGDIIQNFAGQQWTSYDPRTLDFATIKRSTQTPGPTVAPGDGTVSISTRGDLVLGGASDAGMVPLAAFRGLPYSGISPNGNISFSPSAGQTNFTLWTANTAIDLYSAGGDVAPLVGADSLILQNGNGYYPGTLNVTAANGDIRFGDPTNRATLELMPSPVGQLALLAAGSIYGSDHFVAMSGADPADLATPFQPVFLDQGSTKSNATADSAYRSVASNSHSPIAFGEDTPSFDLHANDSQPALVYAGVDIDDLTIGQARTVTGNISFVPEHGTWYIAAKPFQVIAGRDIVGTGTTPSAFVNNNASDITLIQAGRDIIYQSVVVAGPGLLDVQAGRNLYQGYYGSLESVGPLYNVNAANRSGGAGITLTVGVGPNGPDYADFAKLYFDPDNQADTTPGHPLADQTGKVAHNYGKELVDWLQQRFGYTGSPADALAYFLALAPEQQGVFVRQVYYAELTAGGREYNDPSSTRFGSYLRGRQAIAALFPEQDAQGQPLFYNGDLTMFSSVTGTDFINGQTVPHVTDAGVHTDFGGDIQILNPGGQTIIGVEGVAPTARAGLITQGSGDIDIYSLGSILLGQSRIMTTFGGNILAWSAQGDINAGRGAKTTVVYTPPRRVYDDLGNVTLSPQVPATGAGIATLDPIPEVPPGDVDLIAPLGTIDAGEAGIRVSGNINVAALHIVNAANIQVQGKSTGIPVVAAVNTSALTSASAAASSAANTAENLMRQQQASARNALPSIITVQVLGFGSESPAAQPTGSNTPAPSEPHADLRYDKASPVQVVGESGQLYPQQVSYVTEDQRRQLRQQ